jgi:hypothetical protein
MVSSWRPVHRRDQMLVSLSEVVLLKEVCYKAWSLLYTTNFPSVSLPCCEAGAMLFDFTKQTFL